MDPFDPNPGLARSALAGLIDHALACRLDEVHGNPVARLEASDDYAVLVAYVNHLPQSTQLLHELAMTALDCQTGDFRLHSYRPLEFAASFRVHDRSLHPAAFVAALVSLLVTDEIDAAHGERP